MKPQASEAFAAFVGLDWADAKHAMCLQAAGTVQREFLSLTHSPEAVHTWVQTLRTRFHGQPVAVCLELNKGPIVSALRHYDCLVLFPVNPLTVAKYREAFTPSRAKDDPTDAALLVDILVKHHLRQPFAVAEIDEDDAAVIAAAVDPSHQQNGLAFIGGAKRAAGVGAVGVHCSGKSGV